MEQVVKLNVFGQTYKFSTGITESDCEDAQLIADYFLEQVKRVEDMYAEKDYCMTKLTILISAALNIATENYQLKRANKNFERSVSDFESRVRRLLDENPSNSAA